MIVFDEGGRRRIRKLQFARGVEPKRAMGCGQDDAASGEMRLHDLGKADLRGGIEGRGWLVQEPERTFDGEQPGDRKAPPLTGGQVGRGQIGQRVEADGPQRLNQANVIRTKKRGPELQILRD